jgi:hypothetical protein
MAPAATLLSAAVITIRLINDYNKLSFDKVCFLRVWGIFAGVFAYIMAVVPSLGTMNKPHKVGVGDVLCASYGLGGYFSRMNVFPRCTVTDAEDLGDFGTGV